MGMGRIFPGWGPTVATFYFTNSKLCGKHVSTKMLTGNYQISKSREGLGSPCSPLLPTPA